MNCIVWKSAFLILLPASIAHAGVMRVDITEREPFGDGRGFGEVGPYEWIRGRVEFTVDPNDPANATIVDLDLAPLNGDGLVEFAADLEILAPVDLSQANGAVLYDVNNRGRKVCLGMFNGGGADGFLMRQGFIVVWSGWIAELLPGDGRLLLEAPVATDQGEPITGPVRAEFVVNEPAERYTISHFGNHGSYPPTERGLREATLTWRLRERDPKVVIPHEQWRLHQEYVEADGRRSALPLIEIEIAGGIQSGYIYELVYEAEGPIVQGLGLAGIRDLISFLKHETTAENPLTHGDAAAAEYAYGFGVSQSGRCLRQFLYDGFNADEDGRKVFDGVIPHVAGAGMGYFNHRFASPTRHNTQHDNHQYPADVFPFTYGAERDAFTDREDGILSRALASETSPRVMHIQSSSEYWHRAGSLAHTDPLGERDAEIPDDVRIYTIGGAQHGPGNGVPAAGGNGRLPRNPTDYRPILRALLMSLDRWVRQGESPPASVYPRIDDGTLRNWRLSESGWQPLPGVWYPQVIHEPDFVDRGPEFLTFRRATRQPPRVMGRYNVMVPGYGADNNEVGCLLPPTVAVPVGTFTSWNLRSREIGAEAELLSLSGGYIPLPATVEERRLTGDPRPSIEERYGRFDVYLEQFRSYVQTLLTEGYLLEEDVARLMALAERNGELFRQGK
jgi:hypothetical protein